MSQEKPMTLAVMQLRVLRYIRYHSKPSWGIRSRCRELRHRAFISLLIANEIEKCSHDGYRLTDKGKERLRAASKGQA